VVHLAGFGYVGQDSTLEHNAVLPALTSEVREVEGDIDAHRGELGTSINAIREFIW
jgi:hypothetical protein